MKLSRLGEGGRQIDKLRFVLRDMASCVIAFSGGVDSTLLVSVAHEVLGEKALAVTGVSPTYTREEVEAARSLAEHIGIRHRFIETKELDDPCFARNDSRRCYYCKSELFRELRHIADAEGLAWVADGTNRDDTSDYRPGRQAAAELGVRSPLLEAGLTKADIRRLSRERGLPTWDQPAQACLASRFPTGTAITSELLEQVGQAESYLHSLGLRQVRVRHHGSIARIEVEPEDIPRLAADGIRQDIVARLREIGYTYVALDLSGYRTGSLNEVLASQDTPNQTKP
ncbi:MAG: ATP-dependent sacrificial sulfur transferase LarE [Chloroflexi bacterium]|nr:ATP-dependent sacrificial sulfur transferase LarE [Chloroflexota bacterium]